MGDEDARLRVLVLSGGGTKGIAFLGALSYLQQQARLQDVNTLVGCSIGSVVAALVALDKDLSLHGSTMACLSTYQFELDVDFETMLERFALDPGANLQAFIDAMLGERLTFAQLQQRTGKSLVVSATCVTTRAPVHFDVHTHPDMLVNLALRMSCSIPLLFAPVVYQGRMYVDGALCSRLPMHAVPRDVPALALLLTRPPAPPPVIDSLPMFLYALFDSCAQRSGTVGSDVGYPAVRVLPIAIQAEFAMFQPDMSPEAMRRLWQAGWQAAEAHGGQ